MLFFPHRKCSNLGNLVSDKQGRESDQSNIGYTRESLPREHFGVGGLDVETHTHCWPGALWASFIDSYSRDAILMSKASNSAIRRKTSLDGFH